MGAAEVVDLTPDEVVPTVEFRGKRFHVRPQGIDLLGLMKFAVLAKNGIRDDDMEGLAAVYELLQTCIAEDEWQAFARHSAQVGAQGEDLQAVIAQAVQAHSARQGSARPTQPSSGSPGGPSTTAPSSAAGSSSPVSSDPIRMGDVRVQHDLEARGRRDLALAVLKAREAREASTSTSRR